MDSGCLNDDPSATDCLGQMFSFYFVGVCVTDLGGGGWTNVFFKNVGEDEAKDEGDQ